MLQVRETFTNETAGHIFGETEWYAPFTDERGRLFRVMQREYGACRSSIYVDDAKGAKPCGWYFEKRMEYEDAHRIRDRASRTYIRGVWVHLRDVADEE